MIGSLRSGAEERRTESRQRMLLSGKMTAGAALTGDCIVRDLSSTGARISTSHREMAEQHPCLVLVRDGVAYETRTAWAKEGQAGLRFVASHDLSQPLPSHMKRARQLWVETLPR